MHAHRSHRPATLAIALAMTMTAVAAAADWPNFRGPNYDGICKEADLRTDWSKPLDVVWERTVGDSFSSFAAVDGRVYTCGTENKQQVLLCLSADTGDVIWKKSLEPGYSDRQGGDGTRATPTVSDGRVYIFGARGRLACFDAKAGDEVWDHQLGNKPKWGYSGSVLVEGQLAIVSAGKDDGALVAFDKATGKLAWKDGSEPVSYGTPYPFTFEGKRYVFGFLAESAVIAEASTGRRVWDMPWVTSWGVNSAAPIFHEGYLFFSSGYQHGSTLLKLKSEGDRLTAQQVWLNRAVRNKFQSAVLHEGCLYTGDETGLKCVDFLTGETRWSLRKTDDNASYQHSTVLIAGGNLFVQTESGDLIIAKASPSEFKPLAVAKVLSGRCWTVPVIYNGRIYARSLDRLVCLNLRPSTPASESRSD